MSSLPANRRFQVNVFTRESPAEWNGWVSEAEWGTLFQTTFWADRLCELLDCQPCYFVVRRHDSDHPSLLLLGFHVRAELTGSEGQTLMARVGQQIRKALGKHRHFQWFGQPALLDGEVSDEAYRELFVEIERFCRRSGISTVLPSPIADQAARSLPPGWEIKSWATYVVNLQQSEDDLWGNLKKSARKALRRAQKDDIVVHRVTSLEDLRVYYDFAVQCAARYKKRMYGFVDFETMWRHFHTNAIFETFVAEHAGEPIAGLSVWGYNGIISELGSFLSERAYHEKLYGPDLIKWELLKWAHKRNLRCFDLAGVNPDPESPKEQGIRQFKEKWGGQYSTYLLVSRG